LHWSLNAHFGRTAISDGTDHDWSATSQFARRLEETSAVRWMAAAKVCIGVFLVLAVISMITGRRVTG